MSIHLIKIIYSEMNCNIKLSFIFFLIFGFSNCSFNDNIPYAKERIISINNDKGFITKYYFPLGRTDSIRIFYEFSFGGFDLKNPICSYSMRNTNDDLMVSEIVKDTIIIYYKNSNLKLNKESKKVKNHFIEFKLIDAYKYIELSKKLDYKLGGYTLIKR